MRSTRFAPPLPPGIWPRGLDSPDSKRPGARRRSRIGSCPPAPTTGSLRTPTAMTTACERSRSPTAPISRWLPPSASPTNIQGSVLGCSPGCPISMAHGGAKRVYVSVSSRILTLSPDGTATPGTLYVHGSRSQYAVRVLGRHRPHAGIPLRPGPRPLDQQVIDRRHSPLFAVTAHGGLRATLRPGSVGVLVGICVGGTLVEAPRPLRPGASIHLRVTRLGRTMFLPAAFALYRRRSAASNIASNE